MTQSLTILLALVAGVLLGGAAMYLVAGARRAVLVERALAAGREERVRLETRLAEADKMGARIEGLERRTQELQAQVVEREVIAARLRSELEASARVVPEQLAALERSTDVLRAQFKALAGEVLEERAKIFADSNQTSIASLLEPLRDRLGQFQAKVEQVYDIEGKDRAALGEQVRQLLALNTSLRDEAHHLTTALKGSNKTQGNWGEVLLERLLEKAGLTRGTHFDVQVSQLTDDGARVQPDVVVYLPQDRRLVIDAKISLLAFADYSAAETEAERKLAAKRHVESMRAHIEGLASKDYFKIHQVSSFDFVVLFVPLEPAFVLGISTDPEMWERAWSRNVLLVSPSTLLFVVRTVAHLWSTENQQKNAREIAEQGGRLYDKLVGVVESLEKVGAQLQTTQRTYEAAMGRLARGNGNALRQAERLREFGARTSKQMPEATKRVALAYDESVDDDENNGEDA